MVKYISKELELSQKASTWMHEEDKEIAIKTLHSVETSIGWTHNIFNATEYDKIFSYDKV